MMGNEPDVPTGQSDRRVEARAGAVRRVTFRTPPHPDAACAALVGEFNGWSHTATPMTRRGESFEVTVDLAVGAAYRYRFLIDDERWENDWHADAYAPNPFGGNDSVCDLTDPAVGS